MRIGYARGSATGKELETQKDLLQQRGCEKIFVEKVSGTSTAPRTELGNMLDQVRHNDKLFVTKMDRLARSIMDLNSIVNELTAKGVSVRFISENIEFKTEDNANTLPPLLFHVLGSFAQFERDLIVERTKEGRERAKRQGKHLGRPSQPEKNIKQALNLYHKRETNSMSVRDIAKTTGVPRSTIYYELKKRNRNN